MTCSCGWGREASSAWAASAIAKLHERHLTVPGTEHTTTIEEPPDEERGKQAELPLA